MSKLLFWKLTCSGVIKFSLFKFLFYLDDYKEELAERRDDLFFEITRKRALATGQHGA